MNNKKKINESEEILKDIRNDLLKSQAQEELTYEDGISDFYNAILKIVKKTYKTREHDSEAEDMTPGYEREFIHPRA